MASEKEDKSEIRVSLEGKYHDKLEELKEYFGILNNTEIIRFLITRTYREVIGKETVKEKESG